MAAYLSSAAANAMQAAEQAATAGPTAERMEIKNQFYGNVAICPKCTKEARYWWTDKCSPSTGVAGYVFLKCSPDYGGCDLWAECDDEGRAKVSERRRKQVTTTTFTVSNAALAERVAALEAKMAALSPVF